MPFAEKNAETMWTASRREALMNSGMPLSLATARGTAILMTNELLRTGSESPHSAI